MRHKASLCVKIIQTETYLDTHALKRIVLAVYKHKAKSVLSSYPLFLSLSFSFLSFFVLFYFFKRQRLTLVSFDMSLGPE